MHDMLDAAGGADIFADVKRQNLQASTEMLIARAPEVIVEVHSGGAWSAERIRSEQRAWNSLSSLPAVRSGRVYELVTTGCRFPDRASLKRSACWRGRSIPAVFTVARPRQ
jgi:ABC-type Fe3+-hydroxamate transport system substrate-binding protein